MYKVTRPGSLNAPVLRGGYKSMYKQEHG